MFKIQTLNPIAIKGLDQFPKELYEVGIAINQPDAILVRSQDMHTLTLPASVKIIGRAGAGVNNIPIDQFTKTGIPVLNTPGANANAVRELVIAGMLLASRNLSRGWKYVCELAGSDAEIHKQVEKDKKQFVGFELFGKTLGVVGLGNIGVKVANAALGFGMNVIGYDPTITVHRAWELSSSVKQARDLDQLLKESDFITFHIPFNLETKHLINADKLRLMKSGVVLLNLARDGIIDEDALEAVLNEKKVFAYVTDFPSALLKNHPAVIGLPHLGASTIEAEENCAMMIVKQIRDFLENGSISNSVNFPTVEIPQFNGGTRLAIVNKNIPNMVAQISSDLGKAGLNITSLINKSRDDIAYTVVDVNDEVSEQIIKEIKGIAGVVQVRRI